MLNNFFTQSRNKVFLTFSSLVVMNEVNVTFLVEGILTYDPLVTVTYDPLVTLTYDLLVTVTFW